VWASVKTSGEARILLLSRNSFASDLKVGVDSEKEGIEPSKQSLSTSHNSQDIDQTGNAQVRLPTHREDSSLDAGTQGKGQRVCPHWFPNGQLDCDRDQHASTFSNGATCTSYARTTCIDPGQEKSVITM
jgi:hypothetical protein